jgi:hypothetical protein
MPAVRVQRPTARTTLTATTAASRLPLVQSASLRCSRDAVRREIAGRRGGCVQLARTERVREHQIRCLVFGAASCDPSGRSRGPEGTGLDRRRTPRQQGSRLRILRLGLEAQCALPIRCHGSKRCQWHQTMGELVRQARRVVIPGRLLVGNAPAVRACRWFPGMSAKPCGAPGRPAVPDRVGRRGQQSSMRGGTRRSG